MAQLQARLGFTPPLTLLKPLHGAEPGLEQHLATFFEQDYPSYEILFCTREPDDAGLEIARKVAARYPHIQAKFLCTGGQPDYINAKVASMELMEAAAAYDILVVSDSDVRVTPDYLRAVALPFADAGVGAMCCPYRGVAAEGGLWARLEAVGMSVEMTAGVLVARAMEGMQFVLGPTMAFRRETIRQMGGFKVTADYCADDFVLGNETFKLGQQVVLSHHAIDHMVINSSFIFFAQAPGALDEVDPVFAAQGALWHGAHFQPAFWPAGGGCRRCSWPSVVGVGAVWLERGGAAGIVHCRGPDGRSRHKLDRAAGALPGSRLDGLRVLGSQLRGQPDPVAGKGAPTAAGREDAGGRVAVAPGGKLSQGMGDRY